MTTSVVDEKGPAIPATRIPDEPAEVQNVQTPMPDSTPPVSAEPPAPAAEEPAPAPASAAPDAEQPASCAASVATPAETAPEATKPPKPDFSGKWECRQIENLEEFLTVMGVGYMARKAALTVMKSAVLKAEWIVEGDGERFKVTNTTPKGSNTLEFAADGKEFDGNFGPEKAAGKGVASWDGDILMITVKQPGLVTEVRRTFTAGQYVERTKAIKGGKEATVVRTYVKVP